MLVEAVPVQHELLPVNIIGTCGHRRTLLVGLRRKDEVSAVMVAVEVDGAHVLVSGVEVAVLVHAVAVQHALVHVGDVADHPAYG